MTVQDGFKNKLNLAGHVLPWGKNLPKAISELAESNIYAIEAGSHLLFPYNKKVDQLFENLSRYKTSITAASEFGHFNNWKRRRENYIHHEKLARLLQKISVPSIILLPGILFMKKPQLEDYWNMIEIIKKIYTRYNYYGISVHIHPHYGSSIFTLEEITFFMEYLPEEIYLTPDTGHLSEANINFNTFFYKFHKRIKIIHLKDIRSKLKNIIEEKDKNRERFCELGEGILDIPEIIRTLYRMNFEGWVTLEVDKPKYSPKESYLKSVNYIKDIERRYEKRKV